PSPPAAWRDPPVDAPPPRAAGADDRSVSARYSGHGAEPFWPGVLLAAVLPGPGLSAVAAQVDGADLADRDAHLADHGNRVEAGILVGLAETDLLERPNLGRTVLHLPALSAVAGVHDQRVDADDPTGVRIVERDPEERLFDPGVLLGPRLPAVRGGHDRAELAGEPPVRAVDQAHIIDVEIVGKRMILPVLAAVLGDQDGSPI